MRVLAAKWLTVGAVLLATWAGAVALRAPLLARFPERTVVWPLALVEAVGRIGFCLFAGVGLSFAVLGALYSLDPGTSHPWRIRVLALLLGLGVGVAMVFGIGILLRPMA